MPHSGGPVQVRSPIPVPDVLLAHYSPGRQVGRRRIFVQTENGNVVGLEVDRADKAETVKKKVQAALRVPTEHCDLVFGDHVLREDLSEVRNDAALLLTRGLSRSSSSPCLSPLPPTPLVKDKSKPFEIVGSINCCKKIKYLLREAAAALDYGVEPAQATGGLGGAYYFRNRHGSNISIVKPTDEEPFAPNNPNGYTGRLLGQPGLKRAIRVGEAGVREVAAYLLDHDNFASVPATAMVKITHPIFHAAKDFKSTRGMLSKIGSFQEYVQHDYDASEHGTSRFPVAAVHRIAILDLRVFNTDRHAGNILVRRCRSRELHRSSSALTVEDVVDLIPIDHGFCLPETLESAYFEWLHWPQAAHPFSAEELDYIDKLDVDKEVNMLRAELPMLREGCLRMLVLATTFLKCAAALGLTLADIGAMMSREICGLDEEPSEFETACFLAKYQVEEASSCEMSGEISSFPGADQDLETLSEQFDLDMDLDADQDNADEDCASLDLTADHYSRPLQHSLLPVSPYVVYSVKSLSPSPLPCDGFTTPGSFTTSMMSLKEEGEGLSPPNFTPRGGLSGFDLLRGTNGHANVLDTEEHQATRRWPSATVAKGQGLRSTSLNNTLYINGKTAPLTPRWHPKAAGSSFQQAAFSFSPGGKVASLASGKLRQADPLTLADFSEQLWEAFVDCFKEVVDEACRRRRRTSSTSAQRLGTSCQF
eukprot:SM000134S26960  [mRNA]  locus=s134:362660:366054:+ [translate_table: standard]